MNKKKEGASEVSVSGLRTDFYELTMAQGFWRIFPERQAVFNLFFRDHPFQGGYSVCAGIDTAAQAVASLRFDHQDIAFLRDTGTFEHDFLEYLSSFSFRGNIDAVAEGSLVFPGEPILQVSGTLPESQLLESLLLNIVGYQTLVATKAARIGLAAGGGSILEFGMRRAQGPDGALSAARAAYIGGAAGTSNTEAGRIYGIPVKGTMAHSWVMSFETEIEAFRAYAHQYPGNCILLIDTYDTLGSGIGNAIAVGRELQNRKGQFGVRLDSGDFQVLSREVRKRLDSAGLTDAVIVVSGDLDEYSIHRLVKSGAPVDAWGVGTRLVTAEGNPALTGVYKLAAVSHGDGMHGVMKFSDDSSKSSLPGIKQILRDFDSGGGPEGDTICLADELSQDTLQAENRKNSPLLLPLLRNGKPVRKTTPLPEVRKQVAQTLASLPGRYKQMANPDTYPVRLSAGLAALRDRLANRNGQSRQ